MLFGSCEKWWTKGSRITPHEGLDLFLYQNENGDICRFNCSMKVSVAVDGNIIAICDDFLGKSVFISHDIYSKDNKNQLITVYAHLVPYPKISPKVAVKKGDIIASLVDTTGRKNGISSHLHMSVMWVAREVCLKTLNWNIVCNSNKIILIDPAQYKL